MYNAYKQKLKQHKEADSSQYSQYSNGYLTSNAIRTVIEESWSANLLAKQCTCRSVHELRLKKSSLMYISYLCRWKKRFYKYYTCLGGFPLTLKISTVSKEPRTEEKQENHWELHPFLFFSALEHAYYDSKTKAVIGRYAARCVCVNW